MTGELRVPAHDIVPFPLPLLEGPCSDEIHCLQQEGGFKGGYYKFPSKKDVLGLEQNGSAIKSNGCSILEPGFDCQHPHCTHPHLPIIPAPGNPSSGLLGH